RNAILKVLEAGGVEAVSELAARVDVPFEVGTALGQSALEGTQEDTVYGWLNPGVDALRLVARGYIFARFASEGWAWADDTLQQRAESWPPAQRAEFMFGLPMSGETWDRAERL